MNRIVPSVGAEAYQTFQVSAPRATHWRKASCEEVSCAQGERGWTSTIDESTGLGKAQAHYIRRNSGRKFKESRNELGQTVFEFASGQDCFAEHKVRIDKPELYLVRGGDHRGNPLGIQTRQHTKAEFWVEEFGENQQRIHDVREKGDF